MHNITVMLPGGQPSLWTPLDRHYDGSTDDHHLDHGPGRRHARRIRTHIHRSGMTPSRDSRRAQDGRTPAMQRLVRSDTDHHGNPYDAAKVEQPGLVRTIRHRWIGTHLAAMTHVRQPRCARLGYSRSACGGPSAKRTKARTAIATRHATTKTAIATCPPVRAASPHPNLVGLHDSPLQLSCVKPPEPATAPAIAPTTRLVTTITANHKGRGNSVRKPVRGGVPDTAQSSAYAVATRGCTLRVDSRIGGPTWCRWRSSGRVLASWPPLTCAAGDGGVRSLRERLRVLVPSGGYGLGADRTGESREPSLMSRKAEPRRWVVSVGCRDWPL